MPRKLKQTEAPAVHTPEVRRAEREKCERDMYYLATRLGYDKLYPELHRPLCERFQTKPKGKFRLTMIPRGHFKTTIGVVVRSIWTWLHDPMHRFLNAHALHPQSKKNVREIQNHFESNDYLRDIAPDICYKNPAKESPSWTAAELTLKRPKFHRVPSFTASAVGVSTVGLHFNTFLMDDLVDDENSRTPELALQVLSYLLLSLGKVFDNDYMVDVIGTPWFLWDMYAKMLDEKSKLLFTAEDGSRPDLLVLGAYGTPGSMDGLPIFPTKFSDADLRMIRDGMEGVPGLGSWHFACQYLCKPVPSDQKMFPAERIQFTEELPEGRNWYIFVAVDPNRKQNRTSDPGVVCAYARSHLGELVELATTYRKFGVNDLVETIGAYAKTWKPEVVFSEDTAGQT